MKDAKERATEIVLYPHNDASPYCIWQGMVVSGQVSPMQAGDYFDKKVAPGLIAKTADALTQAFKEGVESVIKGKPSFTVPEGKTFTVHDSIDTDIFRKGATAQREKDAQMAKWKGIELQNKKEASSEMYELYVSEVIEKEIREGKLVGLL